MKKIEIEIPDGFYEVLEKSIEANLKNCSIKAYIEFLVISHILQTGKLFEEKDPWEKHK